MTQITIVLPTYNERENIQILIPEIEEKFKKSKYSFDILVVDDSSPDGTAEVVRNLNKKYKNIKVCVRPIKNGPGAATREGYNLAKGDFIISSDTDLAFPVNDMFKLLNKLEKGYDVVTGNRHTKKGGYENKEFTTKIKSFVSKTGNIFIRKFSGVPINDYTANFRAIKKKDWKKIKTHENTNSFFIEMLLKAHYDGLKVTDIPVKFTDRIHGESKLNLKKEAPKAFMKLIYFVIKYRILRLNK